MQRLGSVFVTGIIIVLSVTAQNVPPASKDTTKPATIPFYELGEVVVTSPRSTRPILSVPMAIDVLSAEEIQRSQATVSLDEVFRTLPGIAVDNRYNTSAGERIVIRGSGSRGQFGVRGIKILQDGIPLTTPDGASTITAVSQGTISKVEVIRGPASSLYGNSSTGVINFTSAIGPNTPLSIQTKAITGSYGLWKWEGSVLGHSGSTGYSLNVNRTLLDGYRTRSESEIVRVGALGTHELSNQMQMVTSFNYYNAPYLLTPGSLTKTEIETDRRIAATANVNSGAGRRTKQWIAGLTLKYTEGQSQNIDATVYYMSRSQSVWTPPTIGDLDIGSGGVRLLYRKQFAFGSIPVQWTVGADYEGYHEDRKRYGNLSLPVDKRGTTSPDQVFSLVQRDTLGESRVDKLTSIGPFMALEVELTPKWILVVSGRYDHYVVDSEDRFLQDGTDDSGSRTLKHFSPAVGLLYRMMLYSSVYANLSTGFQVPTLVELRNRQFGQGGINFDLQPELVTSFETGLKGVIPQTRLAYDLSVFYANYNNQLIPYQVPSGTDFYYRNAGRAINKGVEGKLQWEPIDGLRGSLTFTMMDFVFDDYLVEQTVSGSLTQMQLKDNKLPGVAPTRLYFGTSYRHPSGIFSEISVQWVDETFTNDFNGTPPGGTKPASDYLNSSYTNVDTRFGFMQTFGALELEVFGGVHNVLDAKYVASIVPNASRDRFYEPSPDRNWYGGVRILFTALR